VASLLHPDRLLPTEPAALAIARRLHAQVAELPIVSPHGHTDPQWFADNDLFANPAELLLTPDHYVLRMLYSQGITMADMGIPPLSGGTYEQNPLKIWRRFARAYPLFRGTPSRLWMEYVFKEVFGLPMPLNSDTADEFYQQIQTQLQSEAFRPRALFERFNIEVLATTESPLDELTHHQKIQASGWSGRVISAYRPDNVVDPEFEGFARNVAELAQLTKQDCSNFVGYLQALADRRAYFKSLGATSTDHGHPCATTADLDSQQCENLYQKALQGCCSPLEAQQFRGHGGYESQ